MGRALAGKNGKRAAQRELHDSNIMGSPGQILVLFEATPAVAEMLKRRPQFVPDRSRSRHNEKAPVGNVAQREWYEHHVVIANEQKCAILMAARKNNCASVDCVFYREWMDGVWKEKGKWKTATTRAMVCKFTWKQSIGHIGKVVTVMGVHGHYHTMNMLFPNEVTDELWQKIKTIPLWNTRSTF